MQRKQKQKNVLMALDIKVYDQLKIIKQETGCTYNELISCLLYNIGIHQGFLSLPNRLSFIAYKKYVKDLRKEKKMRINT